MLSCILNSPRTFFFLFRKFHTAITDYKSGISLFLCLVHLSLSNYQESICLVENEMTCTTENRISISIANSGRILLEMTKIYIWARFLVLVLLISSSTFAALRKPSRTLNGYVNEWDSSGPGDGYPAGRENQSRERHSQDPRRTTYVHSSNSVSSLKLKPFRQ